ncbi:MAG: hypothetical protein KZQ57_12550, partial [gamma proteobacterium symbiont of Lucinoma myriamae]|nr:hypothetical protein [gamma proteobacterium symbiont of Lucinoma myriamae]
FITVSEPPIADPHDGWCGGCRRETCGYPIGPLGLGLLLFDSLTIFEIAILATMLAPTDAALGKAVVTN